MDIIDLRFCKVRQAYSVVSSLDKCECKLRISNLTLILLTWRIWRSPNYASKWQMGFNLAFKGLIGNRLGNKEVKHADRWKA